MVRILSAQFGPPRELVRFNPNARWYMVIPPNTDRGQATTTRAEDIGAGRDHPSVDLRPRRNGDFHLGHVGSRSYPQPLAKSSQFPKIRNNSSHYLSKPYPGGDHLLVSATVGCKSSTGEASRYPNNVAGHLAALLRASWSCCSCRGGDGLLSQANAHIFSHNRFDLLMVIILSRDWLCSICKSVNHSVFRTGNNPYAYTISRSDHDTTVGGPQKADQPTERNCYDIHDNHRREYSLLR